MEFHRGLYELDMSSVCSTFVRGTYLANAIVIWCLGIIHYNNPEKKLLFNKHTHTNVILFFYIFII